jgi:hypothetical protein
MARRDDGTLCFMLNEYTLWKQQLHQAILCLHHINALNSPCWQKTEGPVFQHAMKHLYQECQFSNFLTLQAWRQAGLDTAASAELRTFKYMLDAYDEPETDAAVMADRRWQAILQHATRVAALLA